MQQEVSIVLASDIIYVTGTVNGEAVSFQLLGGAWRARAARASDNIYIIKITAYDAAGNSATHEITKTYGLFAITDRTAADVAELKRIRAKTSNKEPLTESEQATWDIGKGARNARDLNRIAENCMFLRDLLTSYGYSVPPLKQRLVPWVESKDWNDYATWPWEQDIQNIVDDVQAFKDNFVALPEPITPSLPINTYQKMNDIEQIIFDLDRLINFMTQDFIFSGEIYAGEDDFI